MSEFLYRLGKLKVIMLFAATVTLGLFYTMQWLIVNDEQPETINMRITLAPVTLPEWEPDPVHASPRPEEPEAPPELPPQQVDNRTPQSPAIAFTGNLAKNPGVEAFEFGLGPADASAMPIAQIQPVYPSRALVRGIEGFVIVEFDVNENGAVINASVLGANPPGIFDRAALTAISRWKYNPRIDNGRPVTMKSLQYRFSFTLKE